MTLGHVSEAKVTHSGAGKLSAGRGRWQTTAIIMSNVSYLTLAFIWKYKEVWEMQETLNATETDSWGSLSSLRDGQKEEHSKVGCLKKWQADICFSVWLVVERGDWQLGSRNRLAGWERRWQGSSLSRHLSWKLARICVWVQVFSDLLPPCTLHRNSCSKPEHALWKWSHLLKAPLGLQRWRRDTSTAWASSTVIHISSLWGWK